MRTIAIVLGAMFLVIFLSGCVGETPLIDGCENNHPKYFQECCDREAEEQGIAKPACVGYWADIDGMCKWECGSAVVW